MRGQFFGFILILYASYALSDDVPCAKRQIEGQSVVCVCNATYCDTISSETPDAGFYITYTSTESGQRFDKSYGWLQSLSAIGNDDAMKIRLDPKTTYQTIEGFGGAVTDSAGMNWKNLSLQAQEALINSYFASTGLEYSMMRVPIGGTDFSPNAYAYNEYPKNDTYLTNFTLAFEDYQYKIPMIQAAIKAATRSIKIVSSCWSPPTWMKTKDTYTRRSDLLPQYFYTYALYYRKFLEQYKDSGIDIWAITTGNEPMNGVRGITVNTMGWNLTQMANWIIDYLGPSLRDSLVDNTLLLANDDQRPFIDHWFYGLVNERPEVLDWLDGIAVHWYSDSSSSPDVLARVNRDYPNVPVIYTEASQGVTETNISEKVKLGSWLRAENYANNIIQNLNYSSVGWIEWNLCLNSQGGPTYLDSYLDAPVLVYAETDEFIKQPMFYAIGHFSKFIPRGSLRIGQTFENGYQNVSAVSFMTSQVAEHNEEVPEIIVTVILNTDTSSKNIVIDTGVEQRSVTLNVAPKSITTVKINTNPY